MIGMRTDTMQVTIMKFIGKHKILFGSLLLIWLIGMIFTLNQMGRNSPVKLQLHHTSHTLLHPLQHNRLPPPYSFKMVKANRYCNPPNDISYNHEGRAPDNFTLAFIAIVVRHGDRSPLRPVRNQSIINCGIHERHPLLKKYLAVLKSVPKHNKRMYPFSTFPLHPNEKKCSSSQMTLIGAEQHLQLGKQLGRIYNGRFHLLNKNWTMDQLKVYSTVYSRTFQSALAFLYGFLPEFSLSRLKIVPSGDTRFCLNSDYCSCPILEPLQKKMDVKIRQLIDSHPAVIRLVQRLNPIVKFHPNHSDITTPMAMFDSLMGYVCHGSHLPCIPGTHNCVTIDHVRNIMAFLEWEGRQLVEDVTSKRQSWLKMQGFLVNLLKHMQHGLAKSNAEKVVLYSGHDVTLAPLATALGYDDGVIPPYASRLVFEVYVGSGSSGKPQHLLKLIYNGKDITKYTPFCKKSSKTGLKAPVLYNNYLCPLENFVKFIRTDFLRAMNATTFREACNGMTSNEDDDKLSFDPFKDI